MSLSERGAEPSIKVKWLTEVVGLRCFDLLSSLVRAVSPQNYSDTYLVLNLYLPLLSLCRFPLQVLPVLPMFSLHLSLLLLFFSSNFYQ